MSREFSIVRLYLRFYHRYRTSCEPVSRILIPRGGSCILATREARVTRVQHALASVTARESFAPAQKKKEKKCNDVAALLTICNANGALVTFRRHAALHQQNHAQKCANTKFFPRSESPLQSIVRKNTSRVQSSPRVLSRNARQSKISPRATGIYPEHRWKLGCARFPLKIHRAKEESG